MNSRKKKKNKMKDFDKRINKKSGEELQAFLNFRKKSSFVLAKKGKGSYNRKNFKKGI